MDIRKHNHHRESADGVVAFRDAHKRLVAHRHPSRRRFCITRSGQRPVFCFTEDSGMYVSHRQRQRGYVTRTVGALDSAVIRYRAPRATRDPILALSRQIDGVFGPVREVWRFWRTTGIGLSSARAWNLSLVAAMVFGMITMTMIYRSFGQAALATDRDAAAVHRSSALAADGISSYERDAVALAERNTAASLAAAQTTLAAASPEQANFEDRARAMVAGYPIEDMLPEIFKQDRVVAAYLIAIAKQESQWGKRVPVLDGQDCYNYWGFRAERDRMGTGGHTCFDSVPDAVATVGKRIHQLVYDYDRTTAEKLIVWKCGFSCDGHDQSNVKAWKRTVAMYYDQLME